MEILKYYCSSGRFVSMKVTCFVEDLRFLLSYECRENFAAMASQGIADEAVKVYLYIRCRDTPICEGALRMIVKGIHIG